MKRIHLFLSLIVLALLAFLAPVSGFAQEVDVSAVIAAAPGPDAFPMADAVTLYEEINYDIDSEGRVSRRFHRLQRIQTNWGMRRLTDLRVSWDSGRQTLEIPVCRTHLPDGSIVDTPPNGFNEVTPGSVSRCAAFLDIREMVISHVGVEPGAVLEIDYTVRDTKPPVVPASGRVFLQNRWPTVERRVSITTAGQELSFTAPQGSVQQNGESGSVTVKVNDLPGWPDEANGRNSADYLPSIVFVLGKDLSYLARLLNPLCENAMVVDDAMRAWLAQEDCDLETTRDLTDEDTIQRIAELVGGRIRTVHLPLGDWARPPRPAAEIFAGACAIPWEKTLLLVALLRGAGFQPEIGFTSDSRNFSPDTPAMATFADLRVVLTLHGENYWLAPDRDRAWTGKCDRSEFTLMFLDDSPAGYRTYREPSAARSGCILAAEVKPGQDGGWRLVLDYTANDLLHGAETDTEALAKKLATEILPEAEVTSTEVKELSPRRVHLRLEAKAEVLGEVKNGQLVMPLPSGPHPVSGALPVSCRLEAPSRNTPLFLAGELHEELSLRLILPEGLSVACLPRAFKVQGESSYSLMAAEEDGVVTIERILNLAGDAIGPNEWPDFREVLIAAGSPAGAQILLHDSREE